MWIVLRLVLAVLAFLARLLYRALPLTPTGMVGAVPYAVVLTRRLGSIRRFRVGIPFEAPRFRLTRESEADRLFKIDLRIASELQTGDSAFDHLVYVAGDHPAVHRLLKESAEARAAITAVFAVGFTSITSNGAALWLRHPAEREPTAEELECARRLGVALEGLRGSGGALMDPFVRRLVVIEALLWMVTAYAAGGFLDWLVHDDDPHLDRGRLIGLGILAAVALFLVLFGAVVLVLRGSSRGHRLLIECAAVLLLCLPVAGTQAVSDLNRALDPNIDTVVVCSIRRAMIERPAKSSATKRRRGRLLGRVFDGTIDAAMGLAADTHVWQLDIGREGLAIGIPARMEVTAEQYRSAGPGDPVAVHVASGFLGVPWLREVSEAVSRGP